MYKILFLSVLAVIAFTCTFCSNNGCESKQRFEETVGSSAYAILANPDSVTAYVVSPKPQQSFSIDSEKKELNIDQIEKLRELLLCDTSYTFDLRKKCLFLPEAGYTFKKDKEVTVLVSTLCNQIRVISEDKNVVIDYDPVADQLNPLSKKIMNQFSVKEES